MQIGTSAGAEIALNPGFMLSSLISILGFSSSSVPREELAAAYGRMCRHVIDGELKVDTDEMPLSQVAEAWKRQKASPHAKVSGTYAVRADTAPCSARQARRNSVTRA